MQRQFTEDRGRYKAGHIADWPLSTWKTYFHDYEKCTRPMPQEQVSAELQKAMKERSHAKRN